MSGFLSPEELRALEPAETSSFASLHARSEASEKSETPATDRR
jgi:hypothetical protein